MLAVLEALVAMRQAAISTVAFVHELETDRQTDAYPRSVLSARPLARAATPVCVPIEVTETVTADVLNESQHDSLAPIVTALRALRNTWITADGSVRVHAHKLLDETVTTEPIGRRRQAVLRWEVVASWQ